MRKKKLSIVDFKTLVKNICFLKHDTAEGGNQAIRIKRFTEKVFLPVRKLGGVGANKGKVSAAALYPYWTIYWVLTWQYPAGTGSHVSLFLLADDHQAGKAFRRKRVSYEQFHFKSFNSELLNDPTDNLSDYF